MINKISINTKMGWVSVFAEDNKITQIKFGKAKRSDAEKVEDIELLRALDIGLKIKTINLKGDSFSVDVFEDYNKAQVQISKDRYFKFYK